MEIEEAKYIITYYSEFLSDHEKLQIKHATAYLFSSPEALGELLKDLNWVDTNMNQISSSITHNSFDVLIATRILERHRDTVYLNYCPKCNQLARTPFTKQCRCGHSWNDIKHS